MGIVWEAYHKGVPLLGVRGITLDQTFGMFCFQDRSDLYGTFQPLKRHQAPRESPQNIHVTRLGPSSQACNSTRCGEAMGQ